MEVKISERKDVSLKENEMKMSKTEYPVTQNLKGKKVINMQYVK